MLKKFFNIFALLAVISSGFAQQLSNWMSDTSISNRNLSELCLPGAHDASVYRCFDCTIGANVKNTQTQYLPIEQLLDSGIRYFDLRPVLDDGIFYTGHYTRYDKRPSFGCKGDTLQRIFNVLNSFLSQHTEVVMLHFSHYNDRGWKKADKDFLKKFLALLHKTLGDKLFCQGDTTVRLHKIPLKNITAGKSGKVIVLINDYKGSIVSSPAEGIFSTSKDLLLYDRYSNAQKADVTINDQREKFSGWRKGEHQKKYHLFIMPWTLTQNAKYARRCSAFRFPWEKKGISIIQMANTLKPQLPLFLDIWIKSGFITAQHKPNIITVDIADGLVTRECLKLNALIRKGK